MEIDLILDVSDYVKTLFKNELSPKLFYHNVDHTL